MEAFERDSLHRMAPKFGVQGVYYKQSDFSDVPERAFACLNELLFILE